jgi:hypothetical protein
MIEYFDVKAMYLLSRSIQDLRYNLDKIHTARGDIIAYAHLGDETFNSSMF